IVLGDVVPERGENDSPRGHVLLSLHYHAGMHVAPSRVHLEKCDPNKGKDLLSSGDRVEFVRLWVDEPVTRVTITWDKR
ncbi:MAG TPA: hypothetical protein VH643_32235, partial [Gemmataceae bacterium]